MVLRDVSSRARWGLPSSGLAAPDGQSPGRLSGMVTGDLSRTTVDLTQPLGPVVPHLRITGDAAGSEGFGAFCVAGSFWSPWNDDLVAGQPGVSSTLQELFCAVVCVRLWIGRVPRGALVEYWTDNACMVDDLRKGRSSITPINSLLIHLAQICIDLGVFVRFCWASREVPDQQCADCLSRNDQVGFARKYRGSRSEALPPPLSTPFSEVGRVHTSLRW